MILFVVTLKTYSTSPVHGRHLEPGTIFIQITITMPITIQNTISYFELPSGWYVVPAVLTQMSMLKIILIL